MYRLIILNNVPLYNFDLQKTVIFIIYLKFPFWKEAPFNKHCAKQTKKSQPDPVLVLLCVSSPVPKKTWSIETDLHNTEKHFWINSDH